MMKDSLFDSSTIHSTPSLRQALNSVHFKTEYEAPRFRVVRFKFSTTSFPLFQLLHSVFWAGPEKATPRIESEFTVRATP